MYNGRHKLARSGHNKLADKLTLAPNAARMIGAVLPTRQELAVDDRRLFACLGESAHIMTFFPSHGISD